MKNYERIKGIPPKAVNIFPIGFYLSKAKNSVMKIINKFRRNYCVISDGFLKFRTLKQKNNFYAKQETKTPGAFESAWS